MKEIPSFEQSEEQPDLYRNIAQEDLLIMEDFKNALANFTISAGEQYFYTKILDQIKSDPIKKFEERFTPQEDTGLRSEFTMTQEKINRAKERYTDKITRLNQIIDRVNSLTNQDSFELFQRLYSEFFRIISGVHGRGVNPNLWLEDGDLHTKEK